MGQETRLAISLAQVNHEILVVRDECIKKNALITKIGSSDYLRSDAIRQLDDALTAKNKKKLHRAREWQLPTCATISHCSRASGADSDAPQKLVEMILYTIIKQIFLVPNPMDWLGSTYDQ
ncbi:hypothetical protein ACLOJK_026599 [Asimina triloba]